MLNDLLKMMEKVRATPRTDYTDIVCSRKVYEKVRETVRERQPDGVVDMFAIQVHVGDSLGEVAFIAWQLRERGRRVLVVTEEKQ